MASLGWKGLTMVLNVDSAIPNLVASVTHSLYYHSRRLECPFSVRREDFSLVQFTHQTNQNQEFSRTVWYLIHGRFTKKY
jgi:hypothetical protein